MPTVPGGDSSMFIGAAFSNGVAQPPGYPLITLIYKILFLFPLDSVFLINLSSGILTSLTSLVLFFLFKEITNCKYNAATMALLFAVLPLIYRYSLVAEVFALNNFLTALTIYLAHRFHQTNSIKFAYLGVFSMGLGMSHHHTFAFIALPLIIWLLINHKELRGLKVLALLFILGLLGLAPYLYLVVAPHYAGEITWGETSSLEGFFHHFLRKDFGTFQLTATGNGGFLDNLLAFFKDLPFESFAILYFLPGLWIFNSFKSFKRSSFSHLIFIILIIYMGVFFSLANIDLTNFLFKEVFLRFWQLPLLLLTILSAYGLQFIKPLYKKKVFIILTIVVLIRGGFSYNHHSRNGITIFKDYGETMLNSLPKDSVLIATGDLQVNILRFLQVVKKKRPDVTILPVPLMNLAWYKKIHRKFHPTVKLPPGVYAPFPENGKYQLLDILKLNSQKSFFMLQDNKLVKNEGAADLSLLVRFDWVPSGFLFKLIPKEERPNPISTISNHVKAKGEFKPNSYRRVEKGSWEELVTDVVFWNAERYHMIYHTRLLKKDDSLTHKQALASHIEGLRIDYKNIPPEFLKNLGLLYYQLRQKGIMTNDKIVSAWGDYYKTLSDKSTHEAGEIKKALDHFGKK